MALKRATKSIPLSGGTVEEVDAHLLDPPGMQFSLNGRYTQKDRVEKARSYATGVATGAVNYTPNIYGTWGNGNRLAVVANNKVARSSDGGATWSSTTQKTDLLGIQRILSTAEAAGGVNMSCAPVVDYTASPKEFDIKGWLVAYEQMEIRPSGTTNFRNLVVQLYDAEGNILENTTIQSGEGPRITANDGYCALYFVISGVIYYITVNTGTMTLSASTTTGITGVQEYCGYYNNTDLAFDLTPTNPSDMRLGYARDCFGDNGIIASSSDITKVEGAIAWKESSTGIIKYDKTALGVPVGAPVTVYTDNYIVHTRSQLLDVHHEGTYIYVLYAIFSPALNTSALNCAQYDASTGALVYNEQIRAGNEEMFINGSVTSAPDSTIWIAVTVADGYPTETMQDTQGKHGVRWYKYPIGSWVLGPSPIDSDTVYSHRLCSNVVTDKESAAYVVVQQWDNWNPADQTNTGGNQELPAVLPTFRKPVTSALIRLHHDGDDGYGNHTHHTLISTFDAGQSKVQISGLDEQSQYLPRTLWYWSNGFVGSSDYHRFFFGNRIVLESADAYYWMDRNPGPAYVSSINPKSDARTCYLAGAARFSIYDLRSDIKVHSTQFEDGMFVGTSVPSWYDGTDRIYSAAPIDSPEIVGAARTSGDGVTYMAYQNLGVSGEDPLKVQAVWVATDQSGRAHRSAPSFPVYLGKTAAASSTNTTGVDVLVTPPISLQRFSEIRLEIYMGEPSAEPQLVQTIAVNPWRLDAGDRIFTYVASLRNPLAGTVPFKETNPGSRTIYTAGNVLAADPWPNFDFVVKSGRRLFAHSISDPNTIYYSKTFEQDIAPEFSASLTVTLGNETITAMGSFDDKVILFTRTGCWMMYGTGPDNTGANGDFFVDKLPFQLGCTDQESVLPYEDGLCFFSSTTKEFHVITRDLLLVDIGQNVKQLSGGITDIVAASPVPGEHEIRWYCKFSQPQRFVLASAPTGAPFQPPRPFLTKNAGSPSLVFVYNYNYEKWSIRTLTESFGSFIAGNGTVNYGDRRFGLVSTGYVFREEVESEWRWSEKMKWETPWIRINQLQDYGRFYEGVILFDYISSWSDTGSGVEAGDLQLTLRYDYEGPDGATDVFRFRANADMDPADGQRGQLAFRPTRQKCQAIKLELEEVPTTGIEVFEPTYTTGQGFVLKAVDLLYGAKGGSSRLPRKRKK